MNLAPARPRDRYRDLYNTMFGDGRYCVGHVIRSRCLMVRGYKRLADDDVPIVVTEGQKSEMHYGDGSSLTQRCWIACRRHSLRCCSVRCSQVHSGVTFRNSSKQFTTCCLINLFPPTLPHMLLPQYTLGQTNLRSPGSNAFYRLTRPHALD
jgi:hypothetical protein